MNQAVVGTRSGIRSPAVALSVFIALALLSGAVIWTSISQVYQSRRALAEAEDLLVQLKSRRGAAAGGPAIRAGAPLLEGPTVTVAGASLLQRVAGAIAQVGGTMQSSQVDVGGQGRDGVVSMLVTCELDLLALQKLLYDLEAGMPFLNIDQLDVQAPQAAAGGETSPDRLRIVMGVSGRWLQKP